MDELLPTTVAEEEHGGSLNPETTVPAPAVGSASIGLHDLPEELKTKLVGKSASIDSIQFLLQATSTCHGCCLCDHFN